jgi:hypothetical protein
MDLILNICVLGNWIEFYLLYDQQNKPNLKMAEHLEQHAEHQKKIAKNPGIFFSVQY